MENNPIFTVEHYELEATGGKEQLMYLPKVPDVPYEGGMRQLLCEFVKVTEELRTHLRYDDAKDIDYASINIYLQWVQAILSSREVPPHEVSLAGLKVPMSSLLTKVVDVTRKYLAGKVTIYYLCDILSNLVELVTSYHRNQYC